MSEYLNFCLRTYKYTCPRVWVEPFHILRTYVLFYVFYSFPVSSKTPPISFGTPVLAPSSKLRPRCGKALVIKIVHGTFYSRECLLLFEGPAGCRERGQVLVTPEGFSSPRKVGVQDGGLDRSGRSNHQPASLSWAQNKHSPSLWRVGRFLTQGKLPGGGGPKNWPDRKPIWSPLVVQAVASLSFNK